LRRLYQNINMIDQLKSRACALKNEASAVYLATKDPRTPWYGKALIFFVVAHTFSPIDLIITPGGLWLAVRMIPPEVLAEARVKAATQGVDRSVGKIGALYGLSVSRLPYFSSFVIQNEYNQINYRRLV
jgi:hypothetical protein